MKFALRAFMAVLAASLLLTLSLPSQAHASNHTDGCSSSFLGLPTWHKYIEKASVTKEGITDPCALQMPEDSNGKTDWAAVGGRVGLAIVEIMTRVAAIITVAFVILGGFRYITSQGEPDNTKSARQTITNGLIGLVISLIATATVAFIAGQFT